MQVNRAAGEVWQAGGVFMTSARQGGWLSLTPSPIRKQEEKLSSSPVCHPAHGAAILSPFNVLVRKWSFSPLDKTRWGLDRIGVLCVMLTLEKVRPESVFYSHPPALCILGVALVLWSKPLPGESQGFIVNHLLADSILIWNIFGGRFNLDIQKSPSKTKGKNVCLIYM